MTNNVDSHRLLLSIRIRRLIVALLLFATLYSLTNTYGAALFSCCSNRIHNVATTLDSSIAFIPAMIIPYSWSMILFIASFFMVRTSQQLSVLTARLIIATLLACIVFYLYPARFSFERPLTTDWTAFGYLFLSATDKPFNQLPSLHVSYALLLGVSLWDVLQSNNKWLALGYRSLLVIVCTLIIVSTIFTYQHHLLDILGGFILAVTVLFIANKLKSILVLKYLTVSISGFLLLAIAGFFVAIKFDQALFEYTGLALGSYWLISFMRLAWAYQVNNIKYNNRYFQKNSRGKLTIATWLAFAPILLAYKMMSSLGYLYFSYKQSGIVDNIIWHPIDSDILISATARLSLPRFINTFLPSERVAHLIVVDVAAEINSHLLAISAVTAQSCQQTTGYSTHYLYLPLLDLQPFSKFDAPVLIELFEQLDHLLSENNKLNKINSHTPITLINFHCVMGFSRSIAMQILYLVYCDKLTMKTYQAWIDQYYPQAHLSRSYLPEPLITAISIAKSI